jgi:hypothetical protein
MVVALEAAVKKVSSDNLTRDLLSRSNFSTFVPQLQKQSIQPNHQDTI